MDAARFDRFTKTVSRRLSRRTALASGSVGLGAALMGRLVQSAQAQGATPAPATVSERLFVQTYGSATIIPGDAPDTFTITLADGTGQTVYFSDRPERQVGTLSDAQFLDSRAFDPDDPPNAAIVTLGGEAQDVLVVELRNPTLDPSGAVVYDAQVLAGQPESPVLATLAAKQDDRTLDATLGPTTLFIDDLACVPDGAYGCGADSDCCSGHCCINLGPCLGGICVS